jgi:hypothetical protein
MKLYIEHKGEAFEIVNSIDAYKLDNPFARAEIVNAIAAEIRRLQEIDKPKG